MQDSITKAAAVVMALNAALVLGGSPTATAQTAALPTFNVSSYGAAGTESLGTCSAIVGTKQLTGCVATNPNYATGEGIHIVGGGPVSSEKAITVQPVVTKEGTGTGSHSYCYVVSVSDPLEGITAPSPQACVTNQPTLSFPASWNQLSLSDSNVGPSPAFLWYVSEDGGPFQLVSVAGYDPSAQDTGQRPGTRGGWPNNLPAGNPNIAKNEDLYTTITSLKSNSVKTADVIQATLTNAPFMHDDTAAVQAAIAAADAAGGGTVQFGSGTYLIERPVFMVNKTNNNPVFSNSLSADPYYSAFNYLEIPSTSAGKIHLQGMGSATVVVTAPDHGAISSLLGAGFRTRPDDTTGVTKMADVDKGATQITLTNATATFQAGDDVWLYSGSFTGAPCQDAAGTANECHFSELNTVAAVNGSSITLMYPTAKRYFDDGIDSFGLVKMPRVPHDIAIKSMMINTYNPVTTTGLVYGMLIDSVTVNGFTSHGTFGGGFKRDVTIQNSSWGLGIGDASYGATDEYDQSTNVSFINNTITGYAAPGAEEFSIMARLYGTEGTTGFSFTNNKLSKVSIFTDQTTDDVISGNQLTDGIIKMGTAYGTNQFVSGLPNHDPSYDSYDSQTAGDIDTNTMSIDSSFLAPFLLQLGHFTSATVTGNSFTYNGNATFVAIEAFSGTFMNNTVTLPGVSISVPLVLLPDQTALNPAASFTVQGNTFSTAGFAVANYVTDPGFTDMAPICIQRNNYNQDLGTTEYIASPGSVTLSCSN